MDEQKIAEMQPELFRLVGNDATAEDIARLKEVLESLSPPDKFQLLSAPISFGPRSFGQVKQAYLLNEILYRICDISLPVVAGRDADLLDSFLSGLAPAQKHALFNRTDYNNCTPFTCLGYVGNIDNDNNDDVSKFNNVFSDVSKKLLQGLTSDEKFKALMHDQISGLIPSAIYYNVVGAIDQIREELNPTQWANILTVSPDHIKYHPLTQVRSPDMVDALFGGVSGEDCKDILSTQDEDREIAFTEIFRVSSPQVISAFVRKMEEAQRLDLIGLCQKENDFLTAMVPYRDSNHLKERLAALLDGLSPDAKEQIYGFPNYQDRSLKSLLADDWQKVMTDADGITSIQGLFKTSHDGVATPQLDIRSKLRFVGSKNGRRLDLI